MSKLNTKGDVEMKQIDEIIQTIDNELENSSSSIYNAQEGEITTDVGYIYEWWQEYRNFLKKRYNLND